VSYIQTRHRARARCRRRPARSGLGDFFDSFQDALVGVGLMPITSASSFRVASCLVDPGPAFAEMDAQIQNIKDNWNPTGFYTPDDIDKVQRAVAELVATANDQLQNAVDIHLEGLPQDAFDKGFSLRTDLNAWVVDKFQPYMDAYKKAKANNVRVVNAPGLKDWAFGTMKAARDLMFYASLLVCSTTGLEIAASAGRDVMQRVSDVIMRVVGAAISAGEAVVDAVDWTFTVLKYAKYAAVVGGAYWLYLQIQKNRRSSS